MLVWRMHRLCASCRPLDASTQEVLLAVEPGRPDHPEVAVDAHVQAAVESVVQIVADHASLDPDAGLLARLRALPSAFPRAPMLWVPRRLKSSVAAVLRERVAVATRTATADDFNVEAEIAHRLCRATPQLLLRSVLSASDAEQVDQQGHNIQAAALVRDRVRLSLKGDWAAFVDQCLKDLEDASQCTSRSVGGQVSSRDGLGRLTPAAAQSAAIKARSGSQRGASAILVGGPPVPPGPDTDAGVKALFRSEPLGAAERAKLAEALAAAAAIPQKKRLRVTLRLVARQVATLKQAAGAGPSGWRNSYLTCLYSDPAGPQVLAEWSACWAQGAISAWLADLWTGALARPFWKSTLQETIRPVLCGEALLKFAMGTCVRGANAQVAEAVGDRQFGAGRSGGAGQEIAEVRAAAALFPDDVLIGLDIKNAYGAVHWADALHAMVAKVPRLAVPLSMMWRSFSVVVFLRNAEDSGWHAFNIHGSLIQGNLEGHPAFCVVIAVALRAVISDSRLVQWKGRIRHWLYVDDWVMQVPLEAAALLMEIVVAATAARSMELQLPKCAFHIPALSVKPVAEWPVAAVTLSESIQHRAGGLLLLGTEACGDLAMPMRPEDGLPAPTRQRVEKAMALAESIIEMIALAPPAGARQAGVSIARGCVAHALDYDAGVLPCSVLLPHAGTIDEALLRVAAASLGVQKEALTQDQLIQVGLPTRCAGLQLDSPSLLIPLARAARLVGGGPALRAAVASWRNPDDPAEVDPHEFDGIDQALSDGLREMLAARGIHAIGGGGRPVAAGASAAADPFRPASPERHLLKYFLRHSADFRFANLFEGASAAAQTRLRSASGPTAGASFAAPLCTQGIHYTDRQWSEALSWRLGIATPGPPMPCRNECASRGELCGEVLDSYGGHAVICGCGPLRTRRHNDIAEVYADILEEVGALVRREIFVPELSGSGREAWLDVWAYGIQEFPDALLDITVAHPGAGLYQPAAARIEGHAAAEAEKRKSNRYPVAGGRAVWPIAHETWGRLGGRAEQLLEACAAANSRQAYRRGRLPGQCLRRWRAQLDAALHRAIVIQLMAARNGLPGRARQKRSPADYAVLEEKCPL